MSIDKIVLLLAVGDKSSIITGLSLLYLDAVNIFFIQLLIVIVDLSPLFCCDSSSLEFFFLI